MKKIYPPIYPPLGLSKLEILEFWNDLFKDLKKLSPGVILKKISFQNIEEERLNLLQKVKREIPKENFITINLENLSLDLITVINGDIRIFCSKKEFYRLKEKKILKNKIYLGSTYSLKRPGLNLVKHYFVIFELRNLIELEVDRIRVGTRTNNLIFST